MTSIDIPDEIFCYAYAEIISREHEMDKWLPEDTRDQNIINIHAYNLG